MEIINDIVNDKKRSGLHIHKSKIDKVKYIAFGEGVRRAAIYGPISSIVGLPSTLTSFAAYQGDPLTYTLPVGTAFAYLKINDNIRNIDEIMAHQRTKHELVIQELSFYPASRERRNICMHCNDPLSEDYVHICAEAPNTSLVQAETTYHKPLFTLNNV